MNKPYVKQYDSNGVCTNPINKSCNNFYQSCNNSTEFYDKNGNQIPRGENPHFNRKMRRSSVKRSHNTSGPGVLNQVVGKIVSKSPKGFKGTFISKIIKHFIKAE